jgi:photosystem II stability/assembly factor-like uncharacterized protein
MMNRLVSVSVIVALCLFSLCTAFTQEPTWSPRGIGGGGSLFSPSMNPANDNEFYVGCDMSGLYHSTDFGSSYTLMNFLGIEGGAYSKMQYTATPSLLYCISTVNDVTVPVKSTDGGATWSQLPGNPYPYDNAYWIGVDYNNPNHVLISHYGWVHASTDGGASFTWHYLGRNMGIGVIVAGVYFDGNTIYLATSDGMMVSANGGASFSPIAFPGIGGKERIVSFAGSKQGGKMRFFALTADSTNIYVGQSGSDYWGYMKGVYTLDNAAGSWTQRMNGITVGTDFPMYIACAQNDTATVYIGGSSSSAAPNILRSSNAGITWSHVFLPTNNQNVATGWSGYGGDRGWGYGELVFGLAVAPNNSGKILYTDYGFVHRTSDGGTTWQQAYVSPADQNPAGAPTPTGRAYHSIGLEVTSCWQVFFPDANNIFSAYTDIQGMRSTNAGASWSFNYSGTSANTIYRIARQPGTGMLFAATSNVHDLYQSTRLADAQLDAADAQGKIISSTDNGAHWSAVFSPSHPVFWLAGDPTNSNRMYASVVHSTLGGIYVSNNIQNGAASTWTKLPSPPRTEGHPACINVLNDGTVLCSYSGRRTATAFTASSGVFVYTPATNSWKDVSDPGMYYWTKDVVVDPNDATQKTWYVCVFSGWGGPPNGLGGLYRTTDAGTTWKKISSLDRVSSCTINPANANDLFLTTETNGLWRSTNLNSATPTFTQLQKYPFRQPERVFFNPYKTGEIWVASFGAGMMVGSVTATGITASGIPAPSEFRLEQNYPNPANPTTRIAYVIPSGAGSGLQVAGSGKTAGSGWSIAGSRVRLTVYDVLGREVAVLADGAQEPGRHELAFDARNLASGIYVYRLTAGSFSASRKLTIIR